MYESTSSFLFFSKLLVPSFRRLPGDRKTGLTVQGTWFYLSMHRSGMRTVGDLVLLGNSGDMNILSLLSALACGLNLLLGFYVFSHSPRSGTHRLFLAMALCQAVWCFTGIIIYSAPDPRSFTFWYLAGSPFFIGYYPLSLHFFLTLTGRVRPPRWAITMLYLPAAAIIMGAMADLSEFQVFEQTGRYWSFTFVTGTWKYLLYMAYFFFCFLGVAVLLFLWRQGSSSIKIKKQSGVMLWSLAATLVLGLLEAVLLPVLTGYRSLGLAPLIFVIWTAGIAWAIVRYRMLSLTGALASDEIIACIDEPVLLLDEGFRVTMANRSAGEITGLEPERLAGLPFAGLMMETKWVASLLKKLMRGRQGRAAARIRFRAEGDPVFCDLRFTRIDDRFGDSMGILVIGKPAEGLDALKKRYRITDREIEVVHYVLSGMSNAMIAKTLGIAERTVKAHLSSIFNKLGVNNRRQMAYLLRDYASPARIIEGDRPSPVSAGREGLRLLINRP